ncbi:unnamed protein product [Pleuronectes platessa]|uniref:Uncharacterized protein n=1 Tax=Pleuronectes platessa TaxID=8262 RepID=A0A9N7TYH8_PLEPL|nr:unnamed protein product [Pleuronectes platessa]
MFVYDRLVMEWKEDEGRKLAIVFAQADSPWPANGSQHRGTLEFGSPQAPSSSNAECRPPQKNRPQLSSSPSCTAGFTPPVPSAVFQTPVELLAARAPPVLSGPLRSLIQDRARPLCSHHRRANTEQSAPSSSGGSSHGGEVEGFMKRFTMWENCVEQRSGDCLC